ncbi:hypothetical protein GGR58DRAFT_508852 [Xylaria digitata]|nr:hypothetical protein GGR58DRAFT_508852 [Xylaria digitata]
MISLQTVLNQRRTKQGQGETPKRPAWLVDVKDECIVPAVEHRYVALSYVWGNVRGTEATRDVMEILQQPGSLGKQSKQGAYFTIIAANGWDTDHGLRGIRGVTGPRNLTSQLLTRSEYGRCIDYTSTVWYSRGWTFQEMLLSPRRLIFLYQYVIWECSREVWRESTGTTGSFPAFPDSNRTQLTSLSGLPGPEIGTRSLMFDALALSPARHYLENTRALTFPEDGLNAFLGITAQLTKQFPDGFLWTLPIAWFDIALLWQPYENMTRRQPKRADALHLPSWSWVGWQGLIDHLCWEEKYEVDIKPTTSHTKAPSALQRSATQPTQITPICKFLYTDNGITKIVKPRDTESRSDHRAAPVQQPSPIL